LYAPASCDSYPNFKNDIGAYAPRNIRIENNTFNGNNTGAMGGVPDVVEGWWKTAAGFD
jgi:hypothetical protein